MSVAAMTDRDGVAAPLPLRQLLSGIGPCEIRGDCAPRISMVTADSRRAGPGSLFVAVRGERANGHDFIRDAMARGCRALVVESGRHGLPQDAALSIVTVPDTREALGRLASAIYGHPSRQLRLIGITGTNGKTTTAYLVEAIFRAAGFVTGVLGTVNYRFGTYSQAAPLTTPDPLQLHGLFRRMVDSGVTHAVMEASSHALAQKRLAGVDFDVALFTNLSRDHLDYHGDMERYFAAKKGLFLDCLRADGRAVVLLGGEPASGEHDWGRELFESLRIRYAGGPRRVTACGIGRGLPRVERFTQGLDGIRMEIAAETGNFTVSSPLVGRFNVMNLLGACGIALGLGVPAETIAAALAGEQGAPGRLQRVKGRRPVDVFVDYAHTPDALENVLVTLRTLGPRRIILVFGCGGDRDPGKRALMGEVAGRLADVTILTTDNPRSEDPERILDMVEEGMAGAGARRLRAELALAADLRRCYDRAVSRRGAIRAAVRGALPGDVVLLCGKGHENYQILGARRIFFDDALEALVAMDS